jgi:hypothetical protein
MSDSIKESHHERKVRFHGEAPFAKHDYRYRSRDVIRLAGQIWAESADERQQRLLRKRTIEKMKNTPVGLGFANRDNYGPDDSFNSVQYLNSIRAPEDYINQ